MKAKNKKNSPKFFISVLIVVIAIIGIIYFVFIKNTKLNDSYLYKGKLNSQVVYFKTDNSFNINAYRISSNNKLESFYQKDLEQIENRKIIYKDNLKIEWIEGDVSNNSLYLTIHTNKTNSLIKINLDNNKSEKIFKENTSGEYPTVFSINKVEGDYISMYYHGITGGLGNAFVLNTINQNRLTINNQEINSFDMRSGKINIDLENNKVTYPKGKMIEVNCENNPQEYEMGCEGMFEVNGKYFDVISTKETVELDLP